MFSDLFWAVYIIDVVSHLFMVFLFPLGALLVAWVTVALHNDTSYTKDWSYSSVAKWVATVGMLVGLATALTPTKQTMYLMLGLKTTQNVVESPLGKKLQSLVDAQIDEYLQKLTHKK